MLPGIEAKGVWFSFEEIRGMYYRVLGLEVPGVSFSDELGELTAGSHVTVDMPEDVLKVERVLELRDQIREARARCIIDGHFC